MRIQFVAKKISQIKADCEIIFVAGRQSKHRWIKDGAMLKMQNFSGKPEEIVFLPHRRKLYIGIESLAGNDLRIGAAQAVRALAKLKYRSVKTSLSGSQNVRESVKAAVEGFISGAYSFDRYKSKKSKHPVSRIFITAEDWSGKASEAEDIEDIKEVAEDGRIIADAVNFTRDIVNQIPAEITPVKMAEIAGETAEESGLTVKIFGERYLRENGLGAFLAVSQASPYPPQLIHLIYKPQNSRARVALVGKGLTYDSGGLSLKPNKAMLTMKSDKSGASAILGIMRAAGRLKLPLEIHGIMGVTENMIGKHAYKPDDVVIAKNGKSIEVRNTDAEGRLVLADCLVYAQEFKPNYIIDLATLTGACMVALGEYTIGIMGYNNDLKKAFHRAGGVSGELTAELPFNRFLPRLLQSEVADISNVSSVKYGGAITAALFLSEFIKAKYRNGWVHLDIAGPAFVEKKWGCNPYGASGAGVRLVMEWLKTL